jgi:hypothetical protein
MRVEPLPDIRDGILLERLVKAVRYVADMPRRQYVVQRPEGVRRRQRLNVEYVESSGLTSTPCEPLRSRDRPRRPHRFDAFPSPVEAMSLRLGRRSMILRGCGVRSRMTQTTSKGSNRSTKASGSARWY